MKKPTEDVVIPFQEKHQSDFVRNLFLNEYVKILKAQRDKAESDLERVRTKSKRQTEELHHLKEIIKEMKNKPKRTFNYGRTKKK